MDKEKFLSFYSNNPNSEKAWDAVFNAFSQGNGICPTCHQTVTSTPPDPLVMAYAMATIRVECGRDYLPKREYIDEATANRNYGGRYGNTEIGSGYKYRGGGLIQLTFKDNYARYGKLAGHPEIVDDPNLLVTNLDISAKVFVAYFKDRNVIQDCLNKNTFEVRRKVNGINSKTGEPNGYQDFLRIVGQFIT